jgi:hypothetical protein
MGSECRIKPFSFLVVYFYNIARTHLIKLYYFSQPYLKTGKRVKIQARLLLIMLFTTTFTMVIALLITSYLTRDALEAAGEAKLTAVMEARYRALSNWTDTIQADMTVLAASPVTVKLLGELSAEFHNLGDNAQTLLQQTYLGTEHDNPTTQTRASIVAYDKVHRAAWPFFNRRHNAYGWHDIFLIDAQGNVVFSLKKETDFATNLRTGPWRDSGLARAVMPLLQNAIPKLDFSTKLLRMLTVPLLLSFHGVKMKI